MLSLMWSVAFVVLVAAVGAMSVHAPTFQALLLSKDSLVLLVLHAALVRLSIFAGFHAAVSVDRLHGSIAFSEQKFNSHVLGYSFCSGMVMMAAVAMTREHHEFYYFASWLTMFSVLLPCHFLKPAYALNDREVTP